MVKKAKEFVSKLTTKRGKYGKSKVKAFFVLLAQGGWLSSRSLCLYTGIKYRSLARALPRWYGFAYVNRQPCLIMGQGDYEYILLSRGRDWLRLAEARLPNYKLFISELKAWQATLDSKTIQRYLSMGFLPFVSGLDDAIEFLESSVIKRQ